MTASNRKPAARTGDMHTCPISTPAPHLGGPINPIRNNVWIGKQPAATLSEGCICTGALDKIITGSLSVFVNGKPAARQHDFALHGGSITTGCQSVLIGGAACIESNMENKAYIPLQFRISKSTQPLSSNFVARTPPTQNAQPANKYQRPRPARREDIFNKTIENAKILLQEKLQALINNHRETIAQFAKWFGQSDDWSKRTIIVRIQAEITAMKTITVSNYRIIGDPEAVRKLLARVIPFDDTHTIYLGDLFWKAPAKGYQSRAGILIHELSHDHNIGATEDFAYTEQDCLELAKRYPDHALRNADNYELFMET